MASFYAAAAVKRKLNITWTDGATDERVEDIMESVRPALAKVLGVSAESELFEERGEVMNLYVNACFYEWNHAYDDFLANYAGEIQRVRLENDMAALNA